MNNPFNRKKENPPEQFGPFNNPEDPTIKPKVPLKESAQNFIKEYSPNFSEIKQKIKEFVERANTRPEETQTNELTEVIIGNQKLWFDSLDNFFEGDFSNTEPKPFPWKKDMSKKEFFKNAILPGAAGLGVVAAKIAARSALVKGSRAALVYASGGTGILIAGGAGAIAGSAFEAGKIFLRERARTKTLEANLEQLGKDFENWFADYKERGAVDSVKQFVGMRATLARAEKSAISQEDKDRIETLKHKFDQLDLTTLLHKDKWMYENNKGKKLHKFLTVRSAQERDILAADPELQKILSKLEKQRGSHAKIDKKKVLKAAGMGALIGGVTGLAGAAVAEAFHSVVSGSSSVHEAAKTLTEHAKDASKAVTENPAVSSVKEMAKNIIADKKVTFHKGDTLWGLVKQWNLDHGVPADKLTNKMIMEQVKHTALKNGIDVVAWKDSLDGTGMPDIKIPVGHEVVLDSGLANIGDHFGVHITDHATDAAKEVISNGQSIIQDSIHHAESVPQYSTGDKVGLLSALAAVAGSGAIYLKRDKIQEYLDKRKKGGNAQSTNSSSQPETNTPVENEELRRSAAEKQVPANGVENFVNLLKDDGLLNQAEKNNQLEVNDSQLIHDSLLYVGNYTSPSPEDLSCLVDAIKTLRKTTGLENIEEVILAINPDLKDRIINEVEGGAINNAPTPDLTQEQANQEGINNLYIYWNADKQEVESGIQELKNSLDDVKYQFLQQRINGLSSPSYYTSSNLNDYRNPTPQQEQQVKDLETEIAKTVATWNNQLKEIREQANTPSWKEVLQKEAQALNVPNEGINHYVQLMDEKAGPVTKALEIGALSKDDVDELRKNIKAQQDYSDQPADTANIENVFKFLITKQSEAHGPGDSPAKLNEYRAIGKILSEFQAINTTLLDTHVETLREKYMPVEQFVEYAIDKWKKFPSSMKDKDSKRAWIRLEKKNGLFEEVLKNNILSAAQLKKIKSTLEASTWDPVKLQENISNPLENSRIKLTKRLNVATTNEQIELLNKLVEQLNLACPELKTKNP